MDTTSSLLAFLAAAALLTMTPGLDTAMVLRTAASSGARPAWLAAIGIGLGCLAWSGIVALGLGAVLAASETAYTAVKWAGAAYLLWIGIQLVLKPRTSFDTEAGTADRGGAEALRRGFLTNLLNPKIGVFYVSFLPQFVPSGANVPLFTVLLAAIHVVLGLIWSGGLIAATVPMARLLRRSAAIRLLDRLTGGLFISFGVKLALSRQ
jgi:threonine/homoserine/homoserine lactone efflux protein